MFWTSERVNWREEVTGVGARKRSMTAIHAAAGGTGTSAGTGVVNGSAETFVCTGTGMGAHVSARAGACAGRCMGTSTGVRVSARAGACAGRCTGMGASAVGATRVGTGARTGAASSRKASSSSS